MSLPQRVKAAVHRVFPPAPSTPKPMPLHDPSGPLQVRDYLTRAGMISAIRDECRAQGLTLLTQQAYVLATADHETGGSLQPVREGFYLGPQANAFRRKLRYWPYYGRGLVQLTWRANYAKYGELLNIPLAEHPDIALRPDIAVLILVHGFRTGAFTGAKLTDYVNATDTDFHNARRCINGTDRAAHIAGIAQRYLGALRSAA